MQGKSIIRVDRAEPSKNVIRGFRAFQLLLSRYPELHGKVSFMAFLVPSRTHIRQYQRYMDDIRRIIGDINSMYGTPDWQPIRPYLENNYTQAIAGMKVYDVPAHKRRYRRHEPGGEGGPAGEYQGRGIDPL